MATTYQKRNAGGGFSHKMGVHKNKMIEEWNGRREITEKAFSVNASNAASAVLWCAVVPVVFYKWTKAELEKTGGEHYRKAFEAA
eukprot:CAMPEP_0195528094 /NCGR_PEP_ID=MMETSP0794_2-20130614/30089_1 /TAXON_ID=515487 /ORGANISM="Stephanopyxis turris, Strain CCMP 815" /LENGTH=84 /DNA_ID=CAMNT_0040659155 /DNA_START=93 /DNA_END=347 /DNA_ORIENTATION=-